VSLSVSLHDRRGKFELDVAFETGGGVTALFGRSGAGKTTIVTMVAGLRRPLKGRIALNGRVLLDTEAGVRVPPRQRRVGMVFQEARLFPHLSVRSNLTYGRWAGRRRTGTRLEAAVALLGIEHLLERRPDSLSGGEAQRVAIGRALIAGPEILLMDEPLSSLDGARRAEILPFLERLAHEGGVPILYVSHTIDEVARLADDIVVLSEGKVAAAGPIEDVFGRIDIGAATGRYEASVVLGTVVAAHDADYALTTLKWGDEALVVPILQRAIGTPARVRVRARDVALTLQPPPDMSIRNVIAAEIEAVELEEGPYAEVLLTTAGRHLRSRITRKSAVELGLKPGVRAYALIKSVAVEADRPQRRED
jgi:molybdate transport system ATP-binding protein